MPALAPLIKGYLPVRLKLPLKDGDDEEEETFFFVREHQGAKSDESQKAGCTLFVANVPLVPGISTKILLKSIFGRYAEISRVTVVENPRGNASDTSSSEEPIGSWSKNATHPSFLPPIHAQGKFAHVVFQNSKGTKKTMKAFHDLMREQTSGGNKLPGFVLERIEIQTLSDETERLHRESEKKRLALQNGDAEGSDSDDDEDDDDDVISTKKTGIHAVAERYRASCNAMSRSELLMECNTVMQAYEDAEEAKKRAQEAAKSQPDEDGFVTVSYSAAVGSKADLEESLTATTPNRRKGNKRSRKKKEAYGKTELQDFYRFQRRENRKRSLEDLRLQFEEDLKKVKRMKDERQYKPF